MSAGVKNDFGNEFSVWPVEEAFNFIYYYGNLCRLIFMVLPIHLPILTNSERKKSKHLFAMNESYNDFENVK